MTDDEREAKAREDDDFRLMTRGLENSWPDGRKRDRLQRALEGRLNAMARTSGFHTVEAMRMGNRELYRKFLAGARRACNRDGLISAGELSPEGLERLKNHELDRRHYGATTALVDELDREAFG